MELWELVAREACRDTLAQYTHSGDRYLLEDFAGAFCEDGVLEIRGAEPLQGRDAIMALRLVRRPLSRHRNRRRRSARRRVRYAASCATA